MKKIILPLLLLSFFSCAFSQVKFEALTFSPQYPKANEKVTFQFNGNYSPLIHEKDVDIAVYLLSNKDLKVIEPVITKKNNIYSGSFQLGPNTSAIAFGFISGELKDNNKGQGYFLPVYNSSNKPVKDYYLAASQLAGGAGNSLFGTGTDANKSLAFLEEGYKEYPATKDDYDYRAAYLVAINSAKKKEAKPFLINELNQIESKKTLSEKDYATLIQWYTTLKMKNVADSFSALSKLQYPEGSWKKTELQRKFVAEKDVEKKKDLFNEFVARYGADEENKNLINNLRASVADAYAKTKNYTAYKEWSKDMPVANRAFLYNNTSWAMAEAGENLPEAKTISYEATNWAKNEVQNPLVIKPDNVSKKDWLKQRQATYAMYADTYAFILYNMGEYKAGLPYAKDAATLSDMKDADMNERYALLLTKSATPAESKKVIEQMVRDGVATTKVKEALKDIYVTEKKSDKGFDEYIGALEMAAKIKRQEEIAKSILDEAAPAFTLKDFDGNAVSLESLKGKIVIVDFWATWCGPCIASMPAMKMAQEKLKGRDDVKFVFVDTWENVENKKQNAIDFMTRTKYPFYVLLDDENKMVTDYNVRGIPTKFVIDKNGRTRFKAVGFGGKNDELVEEVMTMVEMSSK